MNKTLGWLNIGWAILLLIVTPWNELGAAAIGPTVIAGIMLIVGILLIKK